MIDVSVDRNWSVKCAAEIDLPLSSRAAWGQMRDFCRFVTIDPFHARVEWKAKAAAPPVFLLWHGWRRLSFARQGRLLKWNEGQGYAFSDLSRRNVHAGFPHIYEYRLTPTTAETSTLRVNVRGRWSARWIPRPLVRFWLLWVMTLIRGHVALFFVRYRKKPPADRSLVAMRGRR